tara:strand:+ start:390 stop:716 length:327 start_codon:yes stop_codon:yes gene_type:complete
MTIELINKTQHKFLLKIQEEFPKLTFQNDGYQYIKDLSEEDKEAVEAIELILEEHIVGFQKFNNFKLRPNGDISVRFQYDYGAGGSGHSFTGVGYITTDELLNGFKDN